MKRILIVTLLLLTGCNQVYTGQAITQATTAPIPTAIPVSVNSAPQVSSSSPGDIWGTRPSLPIRLCRDARVYKNEAQEIEANYIYTIPAGWEGKVYSITSEWIEIYPREDPDGNGEYSQAQYIRAAAMCKEGE